MSYTVRFTLLWIIHYNCWIFNFQSSVHCLNISINILWPSSPTIWQMWVYLYTVQIIRKQSSNMNFIASRGKLLNAHAADASAPVQTSNVELAFKIGQGPAADTDLISVVTKKPNREFEILRVFRTFFFLNRQKSPFEIACCIPVPIARKGPNRRQN